MAAPSTSEEAPPATSYAYEDAPLAAGESQLSQTSVAPRESTLSVSRFNKWLVSELKRDDICKVVPGAQIPLDGVVVEGQSSVDEAMLTGEAMPVPKTRGSVVVGGTINRQGVLWVRVTATAAESTLAKIAAVVADAAGRELVDWQVHA